MTYYVRKLNSGHWKQISRLVALGKLKRNAFWDDAEWDEDMLDVPNVITLRNEELLVIGYQGEQPLEGYKNLREDEYYSIVGEDMRDPQVDLVDALKGGWESCVEIWRRTK